MNRNKLFKELIGACKRNKMPFTDKGSKKNPLIAYFVPNKMGKLMLNENTRVEFINDTPNSEYGISIDVYDLDKNGDYEVGTSRKYYQSKDASNVLTANDVLDLIVKINNIYNK